MKTKDRKETIIEIFSRESAILKGLLQEKYNTFTEEIRSEEDIFPGVVVSKFKRIFNEEIAKSINKVIDELNTPSMRLNEEEWLEIKKSFESFLDEIESNYQEKLKEFGIPKARTRRLLENSRNELNRLIQDRVIKTKIGGFATDSYYKLSDRRIATIAIVISIISLIISIIAILIK